MSTYTAEIVSTLTFEQGTSIKGLAFCPRAENVAVRLSNGNIVVVNLGTSERILLRGYRDERELPIIKFTPDGKHIVTGHGYKKLAIFDLAKPDAPIRVIEIGEMLSGMDVTRDGATIVTAARNFISTWDFGTGALKRRYNNKESAAYECKMRYLDDEVGADDRVSFKVLAIDNTGDKIVVIGHGGTMMILVSGEGISRSGELVPVITCINPPSRPTGACLMPDHKYLVTAGYKGKIDFWDVQSGGRTRSVKTVAFVLSISLMPDGASFLMRGRKQDRSHWHNIWMQSAVYDDGEPALLLDGEEHDITRAVASPDCTLIATSGTKDVVTIWRVSRVEMKRAGRKN
jgi:WD40 repeat protein